MEENSNIVVFITVGTEKEARKIADLLLNHKTAACVNIMPKVSSHFWWQGKLDAAKESLLIVKTKASLLSEIVGLVKTVHSYEVPEIIALPIVAGSEDYLRWIDEQTGPAPDAPSKRIEVRRED